jgi:hypothetical protein
MDGSGLLALLHKYRRLHELRRRKQSERVNASRVELRSLAEQFPGALRELDVLPMQLIEQRLAELECAAQQGRPAAWMSWMHDYHALMRLALDVKRRLSKRRTLDDLQARALAESVSLRAGQTCDAAFVRAVARPPDGRLNRLIFEQLASRFETDTELIIATLFPALCPAPEQS